MFDLGHVFLFLPLNARTPPSKPPFNAPPSKPPWDISTLTHPPANPLHHPGDLGGVSGGVPEFGGGLCSVSWVREGKLRMGGGPEGWARGRNPNGWGCSGRGVQFWVEAKISRFFSFPDPFFKHFQFSNYIVDLCWWLGVSNIKNNTKHTFGLSGHLLKPWRRMRIED